MLCYHLTIEIGYRQHFLCRQWFFLSDKTTVETFCLVSYFECFRRYFFSVLYHCICLNLYFPPHIRCLKFLSSIPVNYYTLRVCSKYRKLFLFVSLCIEDIIIILWKSVFLALIFFITVVIFLCKQNYFLYKTERLATLRIIFCNQSCVWIVQWYQILLIPQVFYIPGVSIYVFFNINGGYTLFDHELYLFLCFSSNLVLANP